MTLTYKERKRRYGKPYVDQHISYNKQYRHDHPEKIRDIKLREALKRAGIDPKSIPPRPNRCSVCGRSSGKHAIGFDHCHKTKKFRGWLCGKCNTILAMADDRIDILLGLVKYLRKTNDTRSTGKARN